MALPWLILSITIFAHMNLRKQSNAEQSAISNFCDAQDNCPNCDICEKHKRELHVIAKKKTLGQLPDSAPLNLSSTILSPPTHEK